MKKLSAVAVLLCLSGLGILLKRHDQELQPSQAPDPVTAAASKRYPNAQISRWSSEVEEGRTIYEASFVEGSSTRQIELAEDGTLVSLGETIKVSALPGPVVSAVRVQYPKAYIAKAEKVTKDGAVQYEVVLQGGSTEGEVLLTAVGKLIKEH